MPIDETPNDTRSAAVFTALVLLLSCAYFALERVAGHTGPISIIRFVAGAGPAIAAFITAGVLEGPRGLRDIWNRLRQWRAPMRLYALLFIVPIAVNAAALVAARAAGDVDIRMASTSVPRMIAVFFGMAIADGPLGEEIGWRMFLLPRLASRMNTLSAALIVGVVWWVWHIPLYAADGRALTGAFLSQYFVSVMAYSILFAWCVNKAPRAGLVPVVAHTTTNYFQFLLVTLFPALRSTTADNRAFLTLVVVLAIVAAWDLRGANRPGMLVLSRATPE